MQKLQSQFSNIRGASKLLFGEMAVLLWTIKPPNNSTVAPRMLENWLCEFSKQFRKNQLNDQNIKLTNLVEQVENIKKKDSG